MTFLSHQIGDVVLYPSDGPDACPIEPPRNGDTGWTVLDLESAGYDDIEIGAGLQKDSIIGIAMRGCGDANSVIGIWTPEHVYPLAMCAAGSADGVANAMFQVLSFISGFQKDNPQTEEAA